jgi:hypothetical protein
MLACQVLRFAAKVDLTTDGCEVGADTKTRPLRWETEAG